MPQVIDSEDKNFQPPTFVQLFSPVEEILETVLPFESQSSKPAGSDF